MSLSLTLIFSRGEFKLAGMYIVDSDTNAVLLGPLEQFLAYKVTYQTSMAIAKGYPILTRNGDASHPLSGPLTLYFAYHPQSSHGTDLNLAASDKGDDKIKVPRPANAFILYRKDRHNKVVEENPGMHNTIICKYRQLFGFQTELTLLAILIGNLWAHEHSKVKDMYHAKATQMKEEHAQKHPEYKYKPRKSSEKKRRMTKKKAAAIAADVIANPSPALINVARSLVSQHKPAPLRSTAPQHMKVSNTPFLTASSADSCIRLSPTIAPVELWSTTSNPSTTFRARMPISRLSSTQTPQLVTPSARTLTPSSALSGNCSRPVSRYEFLLLTNTHVRLIAIARRCILSLALGPDKVCTRKQAW